VSKLQTIVTLKGERIFGNTSKRILKIDIELSSLGNKNFNLIIIVGVRLLSLFIAMHLKTTIVASLILLSQKFFSGKETSSSMILWGKNQC